MLPIGNKLENVSVRKTFANICKGFLLPMGNLLEIFPKGLRSETFSTERLLSVDKRRSVELSPPVPNGTPVQLFQMVQLNLQSRLQNGGIFVSIIGIILSHLLLRECRGDAMTRVFVANW